MATEIGRNFVKFVNKVLQKWKNYGNSKIYLQYDRETKTSRGSEHYFVIIRQSTGTAEIATLPVDQCHSPPHSIPEGMLRHSFVSPSRREGPPSIWDTHGISGNVFANPDASSSAPYPQELHQWNSSIEEPLHSSAVEKSERPEQNQDLRCQSGPSAKDSVIFSGGDSSKNYGADQQRLQISDLHFDKVPTPATFACWKIRFKNEVCTCSQFPTEAMHWIKEVEMVDSVDDFFVINKRDSNAKF